MIASASSVGQPDTQRWVSDFLSRPHKLFIGGKWSAAQSGEMFETLNPATGAVLTTVAAGDAHDIDRAVQAARRALASPSWAAAPPGARARLMWKLAELIEGDADHLALLESLDNGMPLRMARFACLGAAENLRYNAGWAGKINGQTPTLSAPNHHAYTVLEPVGVAGLIVPWNFPLAMAVAKIAPAIAAGCSVILKPAELAPLTALRIAELVEAAGFPEGVINVVTGFGATAGSALVEHPDVDKISFTGSTAVGKSILASAAKTLKRVTLELGGKSPVVVFPDADLEAAAVGAANGVFMNAGQVCVAGSRLFVHRGIFDKLLGKVAERAEALKVGPGQDPQCEMGPLISERQLQRVSAYVDSGRTDGGHLVTGGTRIGKEGFFFRPTVFTETNAHMKIVREEIFGPVVCAMPFDDDDLDAIAAFANDTAYGLSASIWTRNLSVAHKLARKIKAGTVRINGGSGLDWALPFGGFKQSGWGRENGREGVEAFTEIKSVSVAL